MSEKDDIFASTDSIRSGRPLQFAQYKTFKEPFLLESGEVLPELTVCFETYGKLSPQKDNAILLCHALSGDSHVASHDETDDPGWWDILIGPGKPIDTNRFFVVCPNTLGGCRGTTGPDSLNPQTGERYGTDFPTVSIGDVVEMHRLLLNQLGILRLLAVVGGSLGGFMTLEWSVRFPDQLAGAIAVATSARLTSQALAFDIVARNAIVSDPHFNNGQYYEQGQGPSAGLAIARMLGHITYLSRESMTRKFDADRNVGRKLNTAFETKFAVGSYLAHQGDKFVERFDANSYLTLSMATDTFDLGGCRDDLIAHLKKSMCRWLILSFSSDWLFPPFQSQELVDALVANDKRVSYCNIKSDCGHDAFLLPNEIDSYGEMIRAFLDHLAQEQNQKQPVFLTSNEFNRKNTDEKNNLNKLNFLTSDSEETKSSELSPKVPEQKEVKPSEAIFSEATSSEVISQEAKSPVPTSLEAKPSEITSSEITSPEVSPKENRIDHDLILDLIPPKVKILDLGCGRGDLLARLKEEGHERILGVELKEKYVLHSLQKGLDVIQADLNEGLASFHDKQFDFVVLSKTLQTVKNVEKVLDEIVRVGTRAIVSFPNLGFYRFRDELCQNGHAPLLEREKGRRWFNTKDTRFLTLLDFQDFCNEKGFRIHQQVALNTENKTVITENPNENADVVIVVLSR